MDRKGNINLAKALQDFAECEGNNGQEHRTGRKGDWNCQKKQKTDGQAVPQKNPLNWQGQRGGESATHNTKILREKVCKSKS